MVVQNEVRDKKYFAIKYVDPNDGQPHAFYVDFVVYMCNERVGLFDTKAGYTATEQKSKYKAEALSKYITDNKSKKVFGGIAVFEKGEWRYNDNEEYVYDKGDFSDWKPLDLN